MVNPVFLSFTIGQSRRLQHALSRNRQTSCADIFRILGVSLEVPSTYLSLISVFYLQHIQYPVNRILTAFEYIPRDRDHHSLACNVIILWEFYRYVVPSWFDDAFYSAVDDTYKYGIFTSTPRTICTIQYHGRPRKTICRTFAISSI